MIQIWKYRDAPEHLRQLYPEGKEDAWIMLVPGQMRGEFESLLGHPPFIDSVRIIPQADGTVVFCGPEVTSPVLRPGKTIGTA